MKCPFELPIGKPFESANYHYSMTDGKGVFRVIVKGSELQAEFVRHAISSHEKLINHFSHIDTCLMIMANTKSEEGLKDLPKLSCDLRKYIQQALEAEKQ